MFQSKKINGFSCLLLAYVGLVTGCSQLSDVKEANLQPAPLDLSIQQDDLKTELINFQQSKLVDPVGAFSFSYDTVVSTLAEQSVSIAYLDVLQQSGTKNSFSYDKVVEIFVDTLGQMAEAEEDDTQLLESADNPISYEQARYLPLKTRMNLVLAQANKALGTRYRFGGKNLSGFDCSGLVYYAHSKIGISLPRTAHDQYLASLPVKGENLQPGDLVFFKTSRAKRISHVGIYVGNNRFIHAPSRGKRVTVDSLASGYYAKRFVRGGRVVLG
ncbi:cell wall-associated hydrolase, invasion-associated protein [Beggiatoa alba B18LD]|uniref:Cell wall-associated hydrolase, invasion-associated protein n=1 Tax=Beggiatoa alba B18LD TaxID=395493 RepID=I3CFN5_9GAMM|nr:C40 family peptidase [Beggiatoa alba]EIJ42428.1 cell wall-associated hydrolase, invasion-associated protein [Beggiatoa alba B18LD]